MSAPKLRRWKRPLRRRADWEARLAAYLARVYERPYAYGSHDCLIHCANAMRATTGRDFAVGQRRRYRTEAGAARYLLSLGFRSPEALLDSLLPEVAVSFAQRGDLVLGRDGIPGVCTGGDAAFVGMDGSAEGLVAVPRTAWRKAWKVG